VAHGFKSIGIKTVLIFGVYIQTRAVSSGRIMSDLRNMSGEFLTEFFELYRAHPCLSCVKSKEYSDRNKKHCAYKILIEKLREVDENASKDTIIKKKKHATWMLPKEHRKVVNYKHSGDGDEYVYHPHLWYYDLLLFLQDHKLNQLV
jgi:hypothetical protein